MNHRTTDTSEDKHHKSGRRLVTGLIILLILAIACAAGIKTGDWLADRQAVREEGIHMDEYVGLGERTGLTGELDLLVEPMSLTVKTGEPIRVNLTLVNRTRKRMVLNGWLTPVPALFGSNQYPLKVKMTKSGQQVAYHGNAILSPPHGKKDFVTLGPRSRKTISMDLARGPGKGFWDISISGIYSVEIWYETYLTGRYIGMGAWTGMTNHAVVQVTVLPN